MAYLEDGLVSQYCWISSRQLMDAIAIGQVTPGPILTTATFAGFLIAGWKGALVATLSIFLPSFVFVVIIKPLVPRLRRNPGRPLF